MSNDMTTIVFYWQQYWYVAQLENNYTMEEVIKVGLCFDNYYDALKYAEESEERFKTALGIKIYPNRSKL